MHKRIQFCEACDEIHYHIQISQEAFGKMINFVIICYYNSYKAQVGFRFFLAVH